MTETDWLLREVVRLVKDASAQKRDWAEYEKNGGPRPGWMYSAEDGLEELVETKILPLLAASERSDP